LTFLSGDSRETSFLFQRLSMIVDSASTLLSLWIPSVLLRRPGPLATSDICFELLVLTPGICTTWGIKIIIIITILANHFVIQF